MKHFFNIIKGFLPFNQSGLKGKVLENTYWLLADQVFRMSIGFFTLLIVARELGPDSYGQFNYVLAYVSLFSVLATLGIEKIISRDIINESGYDQIILGTGFYLKLIGGIILFLVTTISTYFFNTDSYSIQFLVAIFSLITILQAFDVIEYRFQARLNSKYAIIAKFIPFIIASILKVYAVLHSRSLIMLALVYLFEASASAFLLYIFHIIKEPSFFYSVDIKRAKRMLTNSLPLIFSTIFITIYMKIDQIFLQHLSSTREVGIYSAAVKISEIPFFIGTIITNASFPVILQNKKINSETYLHDLQFLFSFVVFVGIIISLTITFFSKSIIMTIFGADYLASVPILQIHIWSLIFVFLGLAQGVWIISENFTQLAFIATASGALINIVLNIILIPDYGAIGAAIATLISYAISGFFINFIFSRSRDIGRMQTKAFSPFVFIRELRRKGFI